MEKVNVSPLLKRIFLIVAISNVLHSLAFVIPACLPAVRRASLAGMTIL
jgi:hypothetical protein